MDTASFDRLTRAFASGLSRRGLLGGLLAAAAPVAVAGRKKGKPKGEGLYRPCDESEAVAGGEHHHCNFKKAKFAGRDLHGADFRSANLRHADLRGANLRGTDFSAHSDGARHGEIGADLTGANLEGADTTDANFDGAIMPDDTRQCPSGTVSCKSFSGSYICAAGNACCGGGGYNTANQACCTYSTWPISIPENSGYLCCSSSSGDTAYDPATQGCCNGHSYDLATQGCCNGNPYDITSKLCCDGVVGNGNACCGSTPYFDTEQACCGGTLMAGDACCEDPGGTQHAYYSETQSCCGGFVRQGSACCGLVGYNPSTHVCCSGIVCASGLQCCLNGFVEVCGACG